MTLNQYISVGPYSPNGAIAAPLGTIHIDTVNGLLWVETIDASSTGWRRVMQADFSAFATSRALLYSATGAIVTGKISVTDASYIDVSGLTNGALVKCSGSVLASSTDYYTKAEVDALISGLQTQINNKATGGSQTGAASAGTPHTHTQII